MDELIADLGLSKMTLYRLYPTKDAYLQRYTAATDAAITAGFALADDRADMLADADPSAVAG